MQRGGLFLAVVVLGVGVVVVFRGMLDVGLGHGPWQERRHQSLKRPPSSQDGGPALQRLVVSPTGTSFLERSDRLSP